MKASCSRRNVSMFACKLVPAHKRRRHENMSTRHHSTQRNKMSEDSVHGAGSRAVECTTPPSHLERTPQDTSLQEVLTLHREDKCTRMSRFGFHGEQYQLFYGHTVSTEALKTLPNQGGSLLMIGEHGPDLCVLSQRCSCTLFCVA